MRSPPAQISASLEAFIEIRTRLTKSKTISQNSVTKTFPRKTASRRLAARRGSQKKEKAASLYS